MQHVVDDQKTILDHNQIVIYNHKYIILDHHTNHVRYDVVERSNVNNRTGPNMSVLEITYRSDVDQTKQKANAASHGGYDPPFNVGEAFADHCYHRCA